jgi:hypothetical protein
MMQLIVRYRVKAEKVAENEGLVRAVYNGLREIGDPDVHYATFKLKDGQTFVHMAWFPSEEKNKVLTELGAFKEFQKGLKERCEVQPDNQPLAVVDSYMFFYPAPG